MKKLLTKFAIFALLLLSVGGAASSATLNSSMGVQTYTTLEGLVNVVPTDPTYTSGSASSPWADMFTVDLHVSGIFSFTGSFGAAVDVDGYPILLDQDGDWAIYNDRHASVGDDEMAIGATGALDFLFAVDTFTALDGSSFDVQDGQVTVQVDDATNKVAITLDCDDVTSNPNCMTIDAEGTATDALSVLGKYGVKIEQDLADGYGLWVTRTLAEVGTNPLVNFVEDDATSTQPLLMLSHAGSAASISTGANEDLDIVPNGTGITAFGDTGSPGNLGTPTNDDVFINGRLEVDGIAYFDSQVTPITDVDIGTDANGGVIFKSRSSAQTPDTGMFLTGTLANSAVVAEWADRTFDFAHAQATDPTVFVHSANQATDEWMSFSHDQADGRIQTGAGNLSIGSGSTSQSLVTPNDLFVSGKLEVDGESYFDGLAHANDNIQFGLDKYMYASVTYGALMPRNTDQTVDTFALLTGSISNNFLVAEYDDRAFDFAHAQQTDPTVFIHSANQATDEWISMAHDQTDGVIKAGTGNIKIDDGFEVTGLSLLGDDVTIPDQKSIQFGGTGTDSLLRWSTAQVADATLFALGDDSRNLIIAEYPDRNTDFNHAQQTDPTIFLHSSDATDLTQWISLSHDQTNGIISSGLGGVKFPVSVSHAADLVINDNISIAFGTPKDAEFRWNVSQTNDSLYLGTGNTSRTIIVGETADIGVDFVVANKDDPTIVIQSNDATDVDENLQLSYVGADDHALIETGDGNQIRFGSSIEAGAYEFADDAGFVPAMDMEVTATPAAGTQESYTFKIDGESFLKMYSEADSSGGIQNENIRFYKDISTGANDLALVPAAGQITQIGDAGSTGHTLNANDDLFVSGEFEVDGNAYFDLVTEFQNTVFSAASKHGTDIQAAFGSGSDAVLKYASAQTPNAFMIGTGSASNSLIFTEKDDTTYDFAHAQATNPTIFIQSANQSATEWMSFAHDQTNGVIDVGTGAIVLNDAVVYTPSSVTSLLAASTLTATKTIEYVDGSGGPVVLTGVNIANGTEGQCTKIFGDDATNTVTFQDADVSAGSNMALDGNVSIPLGLGDNFEVCYTTLNSVALWRETDRNLTIDD